MPIYRWHGSSVTGARIDWMTDMHIYKNKNFEYIVGMICAGLRFRTYIIGDDKTTFIGYDVTNVVIIDAYGSNNVDGDGSYNSHALWYLRVNG